VDRAADADLGTFFQRYVFGGQQPAVPLGLASSLPGRAAMR
jgi:hypothetical protein